MFKILAKKNIMEITLRQIRENEFKDTVNMTREVFWDVYKPGCDEHLVLHLIRKRPCYIPELDLVAVKGSDIIGHIICTKGKVIDSMNNEHPVLCAGPFSITKEYQGKGYGSLLMKYCIKKAGELGYDAMILFGNPDYYHRFGFRNADQFGITTKEGMNFDPFMAKELQKKGLQHIQGRFFEDESFYVDAAELEDFEKQFPFKEKHVTSTQLKL
jgi:predicted N-acetyltransferase YhbS